MTLTRVQIETLRTIHERPEGRLEDWAAMRGVSVSALWQTCRVLARKGYLSRARLGRRSSRFALTEACGCCAHCRRPMLVESMHEVADHRCTKLDPVARRRIAESRSTPRALAARFGVDESHVRRIRREAGGRKVTKSHRGDGGDDGMRV